VSEEHVTQVFGPPWVRSRVENLEQHRRESERVVLALRRRLRATDPSLPDVYDGARWHKIEIEEPQGT
jgi:hypothetical protein